MRPGHPTFPTGFLVHDVSRLRKKIVDRELKPLGITRSQWWVLVNIARYGEGGISQTDLARFMTVTKVSLGHLIDRMEAAGWLTRVKDPEDRRANKILMTKDGAALLSKMQEVAVVINKRIMKNINKEENKLLDNLLRTMKHNLLEMGAADD